MRPTFEAFEIAKSGLSAARANLQITSQNMTNANTIGYTRQRLDLYAVGSSNRGMRYSDRSAVKIGQGVSIGGSSQIRDPFLDVQYRQQYPKVSGADTELSILEGIEGMFGDATKKDMKDALSALSSAFAGLAKDPNNKQLEGTVRSRMEDIIQMFGTLNNSSFSTIRQQQEDYLQTNAVEGVNGLLKNISRLNQEIKNANIVGDPALEMLDQRNQMLDELSQYMNIQVSQKQVDCGGGNTVAELTVTLIGKDGAKFMLVNNDKYRQLDLEKAKNGNMEVNLLESNGNTVRASDDGRAVLDDGLINQHMTDGTISASLKMLNEKGEFDYNIEDLRNIHLKSLLGDGGKMGGVQDMNDQLAILQQTPPASDQNRAAAIKRLEQYLGKGTITDSGTPGVDGKVTFRTTDGHAFILASDDVLDTPINNFALIDKKDGSYQLEAQVLGADGKPIAGKTTNLTDMLDKGAINESLVILNSREAYSTSGKTSQGIGYYEGMLDSFANQLATLFNEANKTVDADGNVVYKPLFESTDGNPINSKNIRISDQWKNSTEIYITAKRSDGAADPDGNANILYMGNLLTDTQKYDFVATAHTAGLDGTNMYTHTLSGTMMTNASFNGFMNFISSETADQISSTGKNGQVFLGKLEFIQKQRDSISKVDQDEEGINLIMFNQALTASSRVMTTLDEAVDTIINKMGLVGR